MGTRITAGLTIVLAAATLAGCGTAQEESASPSPSLSASPSSTFDAEAPTNMSITCKNPKNGAGYTGSLQSLIDMQNRMDVSFTSCKAVNGGGFAYSAAEQAAAEAAGYTYTNQVATIYALCAERDSSYADPYEGTLSDAQLKEAQAMMQLCPDHPQAAQIQAAIDNTAVVNKETAEGKRFRDGTYVVGEDIQPGTYVIDSKVTGCYWERQDASGGIIDNNFISSANRVQVQIAKTDYGFYADGCGLWVKQ